MSNLHLILKTEWFNKIASGEKTSEYREVKPYWQKRLSKYYETVTFHKGYNRTSASMRFKIKSIAITDKPNDLNLPLVFEIRLGERL